MTGPAAVGSEQRPAETLDYAHHRVDGVDAAPRFASTGCWVRNGRGEHPELGQKRYSVTHGAEMCVHGGEPESDPERNDPGQHEVHRTGEQAGWLLQGF